MFNRQKVMIKLLPSGELIVRVGGGYMAIAEFLSTHPDSNIPEKSLMSGEP